MVNLEEPANLIHDVIETSRLVAICCRDAVAVHRVTNPERVGIAVAHGLDQTRQFVANLGCAHASDEGQAARFAIRVEFLNQLNDI